MDKIILIDGNSIVNRAFYALPLLTNAQGELTNAVYGFLNIFFKILDAEQPKYTVVAFDTSAPNFRHEKSESYKGTRKGMPPELKCQMPLLKNLLHKMKIKTMELEGFEADDILGTLAKKAENMGLYTVILSGDRDLLQIAGENTLIKIPKTIAGKTEIQDYTERDLEEKYGVNAKEFIDVKALMGDASDNIPGVPGIGEKTAIKIIKDYKTVENAIAHAHEIKPKKASENLALHKDLALLSKELATIVCDAPVELSLEETSIDGMYNEEALEEIIRLSFKSHISRFSQKETPEPVKSLNYEIAENKEKLQELSAKLLTKNFVAFSTVFTGKNEAFAIAFAADRLNAVIPVKDNAEEIFEIFKPFFENDAPKAVFDSKQEMVFAHKFNTNINNIIFDTSLAAYILDSNKGSYGYEYVAETYLGENFDSFENILKSKSAKEYLDYAARLADVVLRSHIIMKEKLTEQDQLKVYYEIELPLAAVLKDMELYGIRADREQLVKFGENLDKVLEQLTGEIYNLAGEEFNINSPSQLGVILFEKLGLKGTKRTKQGYSTAAEVLEKLADKHEIVRKVLDYRTHMKLKSTYVEGLLSVIDEKTGKIHSTFNQTITSTGRISSSDPNLQNIPVRLDLGRQLRKIFIPDEGFVFMDGDYSQIELRVLAHIADDETLINAFNQGVDIHTLTASQVFKVPLGEVTSLQRSNAKAVNFGIVYGISGFSLGQDLSITKKEAEKYIQSYFEKYPKVKQYLDETVAKAKHDGYASTIFNRRREIPQLQSSNFIQRGFGERVAMNMPIQGTAADIIKIAMIKVHSALKAQNLKSRMILQVHDELLLEVAKDEIEIVNRIMKTEMENAVQLKVALETDIHVGENWYEVK